MPTCACVTCSNRSGECTDKTISFHKFPLNDKNKLKLWTDNLQRGQNVITKSGKISKVKKPWKPTTSSRLCSLHFTQDSFEEDNMFKYGLHAKEKKKLKDDAVPTIFSHTSQSSTTTRAHSKQRQEKRARQEVSDSFIATIRKSAKLDTVYDF